MSRLAEITKRNNLGSLIPPGYITKEQSNCAYLLALISSARAILEAVQFQGGVCVRCGGGRAHEAGCEIAAWMEEVSCE